MSVSKSTAISIGLGSALVATSAILLVNVLQQKSKDVKWFNLGVKDGAEDTSTYSLPEDAPIENLQVIEVDSRPSYAALFDSLEGISAPPHADIFREICILGLERAKVIAMCPTKGINGDQPLAFKRFMDLSTQHLKNILQAPAANDYEKCVIQSILEDREVEQMRLDLPDDGDE